MPVLTKAFPSLLAFVRIPPSDQGETSGICTTYHRSTSDLQPINEVGYTQPLKQIMLSTNKQTPLGVFLDIGNLSSTNTTQKVSVLEKQYEGKALEHNPRAQALQNPCG